MSLKEDVSNSKAKLKKEKNIAGPIHLLWAKFKIMKFLIMMLRIHMAHVHFQKNANEFRKSY